MLVVPTSYGADMAHVSIIGSGNMGQAIQGVVAKSGHTAELVGREGEISGDVVVLAVPYPAVEGVLAQRGDSLAGKVVVDITNPLDFETFDSLVVPADGSATAVIAAALPQSRVVKAFNTNFAATLASGSVGSPTATLLAAGDDAEAKAQVEQLVTSGGLHAIDAGGLN